MDACDFVKLGSLKCIAKAFRIVEFGFVILLLLWISIRLPFAVRISGEYFRQLVGVILSPVFGFILWNFIVLILLLKYRRCSGDYSEFDNVAGAEVVYGSFFENTDFSSLETVYEDKQMIFEETEISVKLRRSEKEKCRKIMNSGHVSPEILMKKEVPRRTQSEKMNKENMEEIPVKFQRSETEKFREITNSGNVLPEKLTEKCRKVKNSGDFSPETVHEVDELSNEEFQRAIESFIAKQTKFHQQEKLAIVLHTQA